MLRGWLGSGGKHHGSSQSLNALDEYTQIDEAMAAMTHIMNDDVDAADRDLSKGSSPFHLLGKGVVNFMRATLGFEQDIMREASETLAAAENSAYDHQRRAHRAPHTYRSPIYPPGTEYAVCLAQAQLMSAIVGVLNESLTESIKSFYKLRKAYLTLEGIMDAERKYSTDRSTSSLNSSSSAGSEAVSRPSSRMSAGHRPMSQPILSEKKEAIGNDASPDKNRSPTQHSQPQTEETIVDEDDDDEFFDVAEETNTSTPLEYIGHLGVPTEKGATIELDTTKRELDMASSSAPDMPSEAPPSYSETVPPPVEEFEELTMSETVKDSEDISVFGDHPVDLFILAGSNFCFGILMLIISLVPPAFATVLKIIGFKGDRERGIRMLWLATKFQNIHGAMAGLVLFGFYNAQSSFCDIIPQHGEGSHPRARCKMLLVEMRKRYPQSHLWLIEEARAFAADKQLERAVEFMANCSESPLKQLEALRWFERSLNTMYMQDYAGTSAAFQKCVTLNNWSHGLYYYVCGAAHVELYRLSKTSDPEEASKQRDLAKSFFEKVPGNTGKKRFMARQLPFDVFVNRKLQKWEQRAKEWHCDLIDAVGVSPIIEMNYFWNGFKRMRPDHLAKALARLAWSEGPENPHWSKEGLDEQAILALLRATALRSLDQTTESKAMLNQGIIAHDKALFKGHLKDSWTAPCARYEMAANLWREADREGMPEKHMDLLRECAKWLDEVAKWESYDLDARIGMKVTSGKGTLRRYGIEVP